MRERTGWALGWLIVGWTIGCGPTGVGPLGNPDAGEQVDGGDHGPVVVRPVPKPGGGIPPPSTVNNPTLPPLQTDVPHYELTMPEGTLAEFYSDVWTPEQPATFSVDGQSWPVQVRLRGASARFFDKKSWRVELPDGVTLDGQQKLNLVGMYQDHTMMMEKLGFDVLAALGAPAPRAKYVRLSINGRYEGVFLQVQRVDKKFVKEHTDVFLDLDPNIYRCGTHDCEMKLFQQPYQSEWEKETNETEPSTDIEEFLRVINHTPQPMFAATLAQKFDLEAYLLSMTIDALISNYTVEDSGSYLIHDRSAARWTYVPWDLNNANSRWWPSYPLGSEPIVDHPIFIFSLTDEWVGRRYLTRVSRPDFPDYLPAFSNLTTRVATHPELKTRAMARVRWALNTVFRDELLHPRIEAMHALIAPHMVGDPYIDNAKFMDGLRYTKEYVTGRIAFLESELQRLESERPTLVIEAFDPRAGWIEVANRTDAPMSTGGLVLTTNLRRAMDRNVPDRTLAPGEKVRFTASELGLTFAPNGEVGLFDGESVVGVMDLLFYGELAAGQYYARNDAAPSGWEIR